MDRVSSGGAAHRHPQWHGRGIPTQQTGKFCRTSLFLHLLLFLSDGVRACVQLGFVIGFSLVRNVTWWAVVEGGNPDLFGFWRQRERNIKPEGPQNSRWSVFIF